jgi:hypothetical protein
MPLKKLSPPKKRITDPIKTYRSPAVSQQRKESVTKEDGTVSLDDFPTPPWSTRSVIEQIIRPRYPNLHRHTVWEPCVNRGYMAEPLQEYFAHVYGTDIADYGYVRQARLLDFANAPLPPFKPDWVFINPPFVLAAEFIKRALPLARKGVVVIVRSAFLEGQRRYEGLFKDNPPTIVVQHVERVGMTKGEYLPKVASAVAFSWLIWLKNKPREPQAWISPCKDAMVSDGDVTLIKRTNTKHVHKRKKRSKHLKRVNLTAFAEHYGYIIKSLPNVNKATANEVFEAASANLLVLSNAIAQRSIAFTFTEEGKARQIRIDADADLLTPLVNSDKFDSAEPFGKAKNKAMRGEFDKLINQVCGQLALTRSCVILNGATSDHPLHVLYPKLFTLG